ncbi:peroxiredoxin [Geomicrobium sp. JCM 19039]|uniref:peroxiredoxin family protein n=1 Tax=Geomicrobium sp. JCM 19039 TaxID=1460636 RepID=UPI00045F1003|nr:TlpA disulfide reductase family protein [Geomicrobium sp. JCM 19039]GAK11855.1 cytochrome c-type biogenesis protein ResA [Geomicrobium sp. JCM 19039]
MQSRTRQVFVTLCTAFLLFSYSSTETLAFSLQDTDGAEIALHDYKGEQVLLLFFTTWCEVCQEELAMLAENKRQFSEAGISLIAVNMTDDERNERVVEEVAEQLPFPVLLDPDQLASHQYGVLGVPMTIIVNKDGEEVSRFFGPASLEQLIAAFANS